MLTPPPPAVCSHAPQNAFASLRSRRMVLCYCLTEMTPRTIDDSAASSCRLQQPVDATQPLYAPELPHVRRDEHEIERKGIDTLDAVDIRFANELGYTIKLLAEAWTDLASGGREPSPVNIFT